MMPGRARWRLYLCLAFFAAAFAVTHTPPSGMPDVHVSDKLLHFAGFVVLGILATWQRSTPASLLGLRTAAITLLILAAYAAFDETTQPIVGRDCEFLDWAADVSGAILGMSVVATWNRVWQ